MKERLKKILILTITAIAFVQCAKRGTPTGGPVDKQPPAILRVFPDNYSRNFRNQIIEIQFDEYVKLKDLQKQLVISPPLQTRPIITPQGSAAKEITIEITDTLKDNTTYVLNFGQSIVDNNEGNPYPFFKYVFSTGNVIDSLTLNGKIKDALKFEAEEFVNVMLYEIDEHYTDSLVYKEAPRYVLNTLDSLTTFTMENLKAGTYKMVALKEENSDLRFDPRRDKIGFISEQITVPTDQVYELNMYQQELDSEVKKITQQSQAKLYVGYTGNVSGLTLNSKDRSLILRSRLTQLKDKDTLQYWYQPVIEQDSVMILSTLNDQENVFKVRLKALKKDSLVIQKGTQFSLREPVTLTATTPIEKIDKNSMVLINKDSLVMDFEMTLDSLQNTASVNFKREESQKYHLTLLPEAITDFYGDKNPDTLKFNFITASSNQLGNIIVNISNGEMFPVIIQVIKKNLAVVAEKSINENGIYDFLYLDPGEYYLRVIYDTNGNGRYDSGNFLKGIQPEVVIYHPELIKLQANWDRRYNLILN